MRKVVVVEEDPDLLPLLQYNLRNEGFALIGLQTRRGGRAWCRKVRPNLIVLDIMLPDCDGLEICKAIRKDADLSSTPIIFLTARGSETDRLVGLELGANDYLVKPFFMRELLARIKLQFRSQDTQASVLEVGGVTLNRSSCQVRVNGSLLSLTATANRLLEFF